MADFGRIIILAGLAFVIVGVVIILMAKVPGMPKLPGDILIKKENFTFYFPLTTCILLSIIFSLIMFFFNRK